MARRAEESGLNRSVYFATPTLRSNQRPGTATELAAAGGPKFRVHLPNGESRANLNCASRRHSFSKKTFPKGTSELDLAVSKSEASSGGGTEGSNPLPSSRESANPRSLSGGPPQATDIFKTGGGRPECKRRAALRHRTPQPDKAEPMLVDLGELPLRLGRLGAERGPWRGGANRQTRPSGTKVRPDANSVLIHHRSPGPAPASVGRPLAVGATPQCGTNCHCCV